MNLINRIIRPAALLLIVLMIAEASSAAFVWAASSDESTPAESAEEEQTVSEPEPGSEPEAETDAELELQEEPAQEPEPETEPEPDPEPEPQPEPEPLNGWVTKKGRKYYYINDKKVTGMRKINGAWYYFKPESGIMKTGWLTLKKNRYYFDPSTGKRAKGMRKIKGAVYYFKSGGRMTKGWLKVNGKKYFHNKKNGKRVFGSKKLGKYRYYFKPKSGIMKTGWLRLNGKKYYYDKKGHKLFGEQKIKGKTVYLDLHSGARISKGKYYLYKPVWNKSSRTKYLIYVDKKSRWLNLYTGRAGNWDLIKRVRCTIGAPGTPTPSGTFHVCSKVSHFGEGKGYTVWHATGFIGVSYLIHSVVCYRGTKTVKDGRLGAAVSHGCVRLAIGEAKWIYDHVPHGTTVYIR